jgi:rhodanese-related sulfurtransferase
VSASKARSNRKARLRGPFPTASFRGREYVCAAAALLCGLLLANATFSLRAAETAAAAKPGQSQTTQPAKSEAKAKAKPKPKPAPGDQAQKPGKEDRAPAATSQPGQPGQAPASPQDSANCTVESVDETGPVTYTVPIPLPGSRQRVAKCLMAPKQALALYKKGSLFVVDVRGAPDFERYRIPGAMNIPLSFVKTKPFLKAQPFVLVDANPGSGELESACQQLREAGFKQAAVLRGGLMGWRQAGGTIEGDLLAQRELNRMAPAVFAEEGGYADWLVVSVTSAPQEELNKFLPKAIALAHPADDTRFAADLESAVAKRTRKGTQLNVLIVDDDGSRIEKLESLLPGGLTNPVMFLEGGLAGYRKFWTEQAAIWAAADRGPKRPRCGA